MRRSLAALLLLLPALALPGCLYARVRVPLDEDVNQTQLGSKMGRSSLTTWFWLVSVGDAGTAAAADDGGLEVIQHLDSEYLIVLFGLYGKRTTVAYGD